MVREIAVKTLTGKGKLSYFKEQKIVLGSNVSKLLGCWIINLKHETYHQDKNIYLKGSYSIQLWYALDDDQKSSVYEEKIEFDEKFNMAYKGLATLNDEMFLKVFISKYPTCGGMNLLEDKSVILKIDSEFYLDVFQEAILYVECSEKKESDLTLDEEILMSVNPNYLLNEKK